MIILLLVFIIIVSFAVFLAKELLQKFWLADQFLSRSSQVAIYEYPGAKKNGHAPGMRNILLQGSRPFCALVGFEIRIPLLKYIGYDHYGFACSDENGVMVIRTYLGNKPVKFKFLADTDAKEHPLAIFSTDKEQGLDVLKSNVFKPHWWQRIGIYG